MNQIQIVRFFDLYLPSGILLFALIYHLCITCSGLICSPIKNKNLPIQRIYRPISCLQLLLAVVLLYMLGTINAYSQSLSSKAIQSISPVIVDTSFQTAVVNDKTGIKTCINGCLTPINELAKTFPEGFNLNTENANVLIGRAYEHAEAWIYLPVVSRSASSKNMVVDIEHNRCDTLEVYLVNGPNQKPRFLGKLYRGLPLARRAIPLRAFAIPFTLTPGDSISLILHSKRTIGIHELNISISTAKDFIIKNNQEELIRLFALFSAFFFVFTVFSLGLIFQHRLLVLFGLYVLPITAGQLNYNFFFDQLKFPAFLGLNADTIGIFIIFASNSFFHVFGVGYLHSLGLYQRWHRWAALMMVGANCIPTILLLFPLTQATNRIITDASLILVTVNIIWLFYISGLGFVKKRSHYLLLTALLVFVPLLYKSYVAHTPALNLTYFQPIYYLFLFSYLMVSLFNRELTSRQFTEKEIKRVQKELLEVRKNEIQQIGRDLHDQLGNTLASALGYLNMKTPDVLTSKQLILDAINETRVISHNLVKNDERPLCEKLEDITDRFNDFSTISFEFKDFTEEKLNALTVLKQQNIYMIVQEVLNNIIKHSHANEAVVQTFLIGNTVRVSIEDDGIGSSQNLLTSGIGIQNMHKRAALASLELTIEAGAGGTMVCIETQLEQ